MRKLFNYFKADDYQIWAHTYFDNNLRIRPVENFEKIDFSSKIPIESWKQAIFPAKQNLFEFNNSPSSPSYFSRQSRRGLGGIKIVLFGVRIFDLEAIYLYDTVFANDPYYQFNRKNVLIVGFAPKKQKKDTEVLFDKTFSKERLSHFNFDIFFDETDKKYYCGSKLGEQILKKLKIKFNNSPSSSSYFKRGLGGVTAFEHSEAWRDFLEWKKVIEHTLDSKIWEELGKTCLACGKCSIACPTCFCFDITHELKVIPRESALTPRKSAMRDSALTNRNWGNCFYQEFHRIAPNNFMIDQIRDRILFWYFHKFVRIPKDYFLRGCVGCERCTEVCPVGINIKKILSTLRKQQSKNRP